MKTRELTITTLLAATYASLVIFLAPISFSEIQVRVANALIGLVPILGMPAVYGIALGVFLGNTVSPLGPIDLLSVVPSFASLLFLYKVRGRSVLLGLAVYSLVVSSWVAFMLSRTFTLPYPATFIYVLIGISIATMGLGYALYAFLTKTGSLERWIRG